MPRFRNSAAVHHALQHLKPQHAAFVIEYYKDHATRRAAEAAGFAPDTGYELLKREDVVNALAVLNMERLEYADVTKEWALLEAVDNHYIARQQGSITASNTALSLIMKHTDVDAFAADKVQINSSKEVMERLRRARDRMQTDGDDLDEPSFM